MRRDCGLWNDGVGSSSVDAPSSQPYSSLYMSNTERQLKQAALAELLQDKLLQYFEKKLDGDALTDTGAATLARLLMANGWSLDPNRLPQGIREKLTRTVDPTELTDDDVDVIGRIAV